MRPRRTDARLSDAYRKDPRQEAFLEQLNAALAPGERASYRELEERFPTLHVVGAPRSGTTLVTQLVASLKRSYRWRISK